MRRFVCASLAAALAAGGAGDAAAEKKKPGLFDFETWKSPVRRERDAAASLAPAALDLSPAPGVGGGETHGVRLRIYADDGYRGAVMRWQTKVRGQIERLNRVVQPVFNVVFEIESLREWRRDKGAGGDLSVVRKELEAADGGKDVEWVIGLTTPFRGVAANIHEIGQAALLSRHMVLRGMDDEQEGLALDKELDLLSGAERRRVYEERRTHKEVVVFLHEWAHTLGVVHSDDRDRIMNPIYSNLASRFSDEEKDAIARALERLRTRGAPPASEAAASTPGVGATMPVSLAEAFNRAATEANAGRPLEAWRLLAPSLVEIERPDAGVLDGATWVQLARLASNVGAFSAADAALVRAGKAPGAAEVAADVETNRRRMNVPRDGATSGVAPEKEPAYVVAFVAAAAAISRGAVKVGRPLLAALAADYPDAVGVEVLNCEQELRARRIAAAERRCQAALAKYADSPRAHFLAGVIAATTNRAALAEKQLRQAIDLDPPDPNAWRELARHYRAHQAGMRADALAAQYQALFSKPLGD